MKIRGGFDKLLSSNFVTNSYALLLGLGAVYWLPGVSPILLLIVKSSLFVFCVSVAIAVLLVRRDFVFCGGMPSFVVFCSFLLASIPAAISGDFSKSLYHYQNAVQIFLFLVATAAIIKYGRVIVVAKRAVFIFYCLASFSVFMMIAFSTYRNPLNSLLSVSDTGLGGSRTGWSPAIALFMPWAYSVGSSSYILTAFKIFVLGSNQVLTAGRTGMLASMAPVFILGVLSKRVKVLIFVFFAVFVVSIYAIKNLEGLRLDKGGIDSIESLDELSTGRVGDYIIAGKIILESPFTGQGFNDLAHGGEYASPHNVFIRLTAIGGVFLGGSALGLVFLGLFSGYNKFRSSPVRQAAFLTLVSGFFVAMLEPQFIFGNFNNSIFWWFCFCLCVSKRV